MTCGSFVFVKAPNSGALGYVFNGKVHYNQSTDKLHTLQSVFDVTHLDKLPKVGIVYSYSNVEPEALELGAWKACTLMVFILVAAWAPRMLPFITIITPRPTDSEAPAVTTAL